MEKAITSSRIPSGAELYALKQKARRERSEALARFFLAAAKWVGAGAKHLLTRPYAVRISTREVHHA